MFSRGQLADDFRRLGVVPGETIMLHASVRAVGEVAGGPDQIHLALRDVLAERGTLVMYASCPRYVDEVGRGHLSEDAEHEILQKMPIFDPLTARASHYNGILVEFFRTWPGTVVNPHPARFAAAGHQAGYLISEQPWDFAFGRGSLLERFLNLGGRILLLGSDHDAVTFLHYVEHVADFPNKRIMRFKVPGQRNGERVWLDMQEVDTGDAAHDNWPDRFFARIVDSYLAETGNTGALVGKAQSHLIPARGLCEFAEPIMKVVAADAAATAILS
jgi:aminoglycoside 3-N-acetyltransferase